MDAATNPWSTRLSAAALLFLVAGGLPLFVCMPPWADVTFYDLCARNVLQGGVHYRDVFDTNLPGMVWMHVAVRLLFGWRSEVIRLADASVLAGVFYLLWRWQKALEMPAGARRWALAALVAFYFSTTEGNHCQRDVWMLLPALIAASLRVRQVERPCSEATPPGQIALGAAVEGVCWAVAVWIKPHVLIVAGACWFTALLLSEKLSPGRLLADGLGVLAGGMAAGALGLWWLIASGAWPHFLEVMLRWNPEYVAGRFRWSARIAFALERFHPWGLVHLPAVALACVACVRFRTTPRRRVLLAALYLGWLIQAVFVQRNHEYVHVPAVLLGMALVAERWCRLPVGARERVGFAGLALFLLLGHPLLRPGRLALWGRCWCEGSTAELRDRLRLTGGALTTDWVDLARTADAVRALGLQDGELTCYNNFTHPLLLDLGLRPSTRVLHFDVILSAFPRRREEVRRALATSRQCYVVSDAAALPDAAASAGLYPWNEPVVFRAGRYAVHRVTGPVAPLTEVSRRSLTDRMRH